MFKQFTESPQPDFYDVENDSDSYTPTVSVEPCEECDVLVVGTEDGYSFIENIIHDKGKSFKLEDKVYRLQSIKNSDDSNYVAEAILKGKPKQVVVLTSRPLYLLKNEDIDTMKLLSTMKKSTLDPPMFVSGAAASFYNVCKHLKIPCDVYCAFHSTYQPMVSPSRYGMKKKAFDLFSTIDFLPNFDFKHVEQSTMYC